MIIVGAGMAGLLAANMLRRHSPTVVEKAKGPPNNHNSVLRFRSSVVGDTLGIPFKKVNMIKSTVVWQNPVADAMAYSYKNTGVYRSDRSITSGLVSEVRYIAPSNLIGQMFDGVSGEILFKTTFNPDCGNTPVISTMPMPHLMVSLNYKERLDFQFVWTSGFNVKARIKDCDAYISLLVPDPNYNFSRISITGDELFIEVYNNPKEKLLGDEIISQAAYLLGIQSNKFYEVDVREQKFAKINPVDDGARKRFMHWATVNHNIYSLGRFATWRPNLLLDDLVNDIRLIENWIGQGSKYEAAKAS